MNVRSTSGASVTSSLDGNPIANEILFQVTSNWLAVDSSKNIENAVTCKLTANCPSSMTLDDIVDEHRCLEIKPNGDDKDECTIEIKMKSKHKILRIGVGSEASVLEIFREAGEYATTTFAEFVDEFEDASIYFAEIAFNRPTAEASIKFKGIKNFNRTSMFLYGIRTILEEVTMKYDPTQTPYPYLMDVLWEYAMGAGKRNEGKTETANRSKRVTDDIIQNALDQQKEKLIDNNNEKSDETKSCTKNGTKLGNILSTSSEALEALINTKLQQMEVRIIDRIDTLEAKTNKKLDDIMEILKTMKSNP